MRKLTVLVAAGVGYVLGTKAGRERYEQIRGVAKRVKNNPRVQEKTQQAADVARAQAPVVKDKLVGAADAAAHKVKPTSGSHVEDKLHPDSTARQKDGHPQGDLP